MIARAYNYLYLILLTTGLLHLALQWGMPSTPSYLSSKALIAVPLCILLCEAFLFTADMFDSCPALALELLLLALGHLIFVIYLIIKHTPSFTESASEGLIALCRGLNAIVFSSALVMLAWMKNY